jgi:hypothetical protein
MTQDFGTPIPPVVDEIPPMPPVAPKKNKQTMWIIIAVVAVVLCCCCVFGLAAYFYGDQVLNAINGTTLAPIRLI